MADGLTDLFTTQFSTTLELLLQQKGSKLRSTVREGSHVGKQASPINQAGAIKSNRPAGRFAPKTRTDTNYVRRWVFPVDGDMSQLFDTFDELRTITDPKSLAAVNASYAVGRDYDDEIIRATTGDAKLGQDGASFTTETFDTSKFQIASTFGASAATGLTVAKIIETKRVLEHYENDLDEEMPTMAIGSQQHSDLLNQAQVVSTEFRSTPVYDGKGNVTQFLGFTIKRLERLKVASNVRSVLAWVSSGMYLGVWKDMTNEANKRTDLTGNPWELYTMFSFGGSRLQPGKVIEILCADTTGAAINP